MNEVGRVLVEWDRNTFIALNHGLKNPVLDFVMPVITDIGLGHVQAVIVIGLAVYLGIRAGEVHPTEFREGPWAVVTARRSWIALLLMWSSVVARRSWIAPLLLSYALGGLAATGLKTIPRERPWWFYEHQHERGMDMDVRVLTVEGVYPLKVRGFPSGHTTTTVGMATVLTWLYVRRRYGLWMAVGVWALAGIVALSRIYLASHWPLDIVAGAILGIISGIVSVLICRQWALTGEKRRLLADEQGIGDAA